MNSGMLDVLAFARMENLPGLARRAIGLNAWTQDDFLPAVTPEQRLALQALARAVRGSAPAHPAVFIHGVLPRCGTNLISDILALHPDALQNPGRLWEFPLLRVANGAEAFEREFKFLFPPNGEVMPTNSLVTLLAQGWLRALRQQANGARMIFKTPHMQNISLFDAVFPDEKLFLVIRDGRDVVASSLASFKGNRLLRKGFAALAHEWSLASRAALHTADRLKGQAMLVRYEDLARANRPFTENLLRHAELDPKTYPWDKLASLPVRGSSELAAEGDIDWQEKAKPDGFNPVGRWQQWPVRLKRKFRDIAGPALIEAGYENGNGW